MATIQWRPEINPLTIPQSYRIRYLPRHVAGYKEIAAEIAKEHPNYNEELVLTVMTALSEKIQERLINGDQVTLTNAFTFTLSFTGRLEEPDEPLPDLEESLRVRIYPSPPFVAAVRQAARTERLIMAKKLPLITAAEDTLFKLNDVLNPQGVLRLTGSDLYFEKESGGGECVIEGTRSGRAVQTRFPLISNTAILLMPEIPVQASPWNNEYTVSVSTHYSKHGSLRTGTYSRMLRTPLEVAGFGDETGILTGRMNSPLVTIINGAAGMDETLRIQAVLDLREDILRFNLIDMQEGGQAGPEVPVTADGEYTLPGFAGSAVTDLSIRVYRYATLRAMLRNEYTGRLTDILEIRMT